MKKQWKQLIIGLMSLSIFACGGAENKETELALLGLVAGSEQRVMEPTPLQSKALEVGKGMGSSALRSEVEASLSDINEKLKDLYSFATDAEKREMKAQVLKTASEHGKHESAQNLVNKPDHEFMTSLFELQLKESSKIDLGGSIDGKSKSTRGWAGGWVCRINGFGDFFLGYDYWPAVFVCGFFGGHLIGWDAPPICISTGGLWGCN